MANLIWNYVNVAFSILEIILHSLLSSSKMDYAFALRYLAKYIAIIYLY